MSAPSSSRIVVSQQCATDAPYVDSASRLTKLFRYLIPGLLVVYMVYFGIFKPEQESANIFDLIFLGFIMAGNIFVIIDSGRWNAKGWYLVAAAQVAWCIGIGLQFTNWSSFSDVFLIARVVLSLVALFALLHIFCTRLPLPVIINGVIITLAGATSALYALEELGITFLSPSETIIALFYPILTLSMFAFMLGIYAILNEQNNPILLLAGSGIGLFAGMDFIKLLVFPYSQESSSLFLLVGWVAAFTLVSRGASARRPQYTQLWRNSPATSFFPTFSAVVVLGILVFGHPNIVVSILAAVTILGSIARTIDAHVEINRENNEKKELVSQLQHRSVTDALTGLANRRGLYDELARVKQSHKQIALVLIDLDHFKQVNDTLGHDYGDHLLIGVGQRLQECSEENIFPARLGGDEFAVLLSGNKALTTGLAMATAQQIHAHLVEPLLIQGSTPMSVEASFGVAMGYENTSETVILQQADAAMYVAKRNGYGVRMWESSMNSSSEKKLHLTGELREAIFNQQLCLYYQPKVDALTGNLSGVESLVRWNHPELGLIYPADFIPHAESTALIHALTDFVLGKAVAQAAQWHKMGQAKVVSVNLSARSLLSVDIVDKIIYLLESFDCPPALLDIEITESTVLEDLQACVAKLRELRDFGVSISFDDFGAGATSLSNLEILPIDTLKIDYSMVKNVMHSETKSIVLCSIIALAHKLGMSVVLEGIEDEEVYEYVKSISVTGPVYLQGFFISEPLTAEGIYAWENKTEIGIVT